jgi:hypothetical protein
MIPEQSGVENNFNYNYLLVQTILKMRDAQSDEDIPRYWTYFEYGIGLVISHLDFKLRGEIEQDYTLLRAAFNKINNSSLNPQTKKTVTNRIKEDFANAHRFYIMQALNRVGIVKVEDEGIIDFESTDLDILTKAVRDTSNTNAVAAFKAQEGKSTPPIVKPTMVLVTYKDKVIQMPKEDYDKLQHDEAPVLMGEMPDDLDSESEGVVDEGIEEEVQTSIGTTDASPSPEKPWKPRWDMNK